jgi:hypothetical protein
MEDIYRDLIADAVLGETDSLEGEMPSARVLRRRHKLRFAKMIKGETLAETVAEPPQPGESIHIEDDSQIRKLMVSFDRGFEPGVIVVLRRLPKW